MSYGIISLLQSLGELDWLDWKCLILNNFIEFCGKIGPFPLSTPASRPPPPPPHPRHGKILTWLFQVLFVFFLKDIGLFTFSLFFESVVEIRIF